MSKTIFEKIVSGEVTSYKIYEDDLVLSFLDLSQASRGHTLVITKKRYKDIFEIPEDVLSHLMVVVKRLSLVIRDSLGAEGINILNNNHAVAGQSVFHFHVHIIPRYDDGSMPLNLVNHFGQTTEDEFLELRNIITKNLI